MLNRNARLMTMTSGLALVVASAVGTGTAVAAPIRGTVPGQGIGAQVRAAEQQQLREIEAPAAWTLSKGKGITVAVLDTGVDGSAVDLAGSVSIGPDYTMGANPPGYQPPHLHGTYIASLIAGHGSGPGRAEGVIGIAPAAKVLSVRVIPDDQEPGFRLYNASPHFTDAVGRGIRYAVGHGAKVINMSLGGPSPSRQTRAAVAYAIAHDVVVVAAAGNSGSARASFSPYSYPASYTGVISVGAATGQGTRASFSERNSSVLISAPGVMIVGAGPGSGQYIQASGTSPASAFVAGVATLIRAAYPKLSPTLVAQALITSTRHRPTGNYSPSTGFGEVDAVAAMRAASRLTSAKPSPGLASTGHFASVAGPIQVTHRDTARIWAYAGVAVAGALGFLATILVLGIRSRRRRVPRQPGSPGQPGLPGQSGQPGPPGPWFADGV
jgi:type VII secretion-associated serine protease mycosin